MSPRVESRGCGRGPSVRSMRDLTAPHAKTPIRPEVSMRKLIAPLMFLPALALVWTAQDSPTRAAAPAAADQAASEHPAAKAAPLPKGPVLTGEDGQPIK